MDCSLLQTFIWVKYKCCKWCNWKYFRYFKYCGNRKYSYWNSSGYGYSCSNSNYNTSACEFTAINLNGSVSGGFGSGYVYDWNGPNSFTSSDQSPNVTDSAQTPMDGTYTLVVTDGNSCSSLAAQVNITVHVLPVIDVGNGEEFCYDDGNQTLVGSPTGGSGLVVEL